MKISTRITVSLVLALILSPLGMAQTGFKTLDFLYSISGTNILSGQHNDQKAFHGEETGADYWTEEVFEVTGKYPALWGGDLLFHGNSYMRWEVAYEAEKQWKQGAVVNIMWHACPPNMSEPCNWDGGILSSLTGEEWTDLLTDGGSLNTLWKTRIDEIAAPYLQYLEDKGVEVLWRPFHEQNQTLFWWNSGTAENTKALWRLTHDYMSNELGLTNLIWSWDVQDIHASYAQYNPGDAYFDMAAIDIYSDGFTNLKYYNSLVEQADGKPVAFGECFKLPSSSVMNTQSLMSFFMIWSYGLYEDYSGSATNSVQDIIDTYNNPRVITLDEMPGWTSFCAYEGVVPSVPGVIEAENFGICGEDASWADSDTINVPGYYRDDAGVDIDTIESGGYCLVDIVSGEWTEYPVRIDTTGTYVLEIGVASDFDAKSFHIELNGGDITGAVSVPNTGGMQAWDTLSIPIDVLVAGTNDLRLMMDTEGFSIDFMKFVLDNKSPHGSITVPEDGATFGKGTDITITVDAGDPDGEIAMVEFFNGTKKLGEASSEPFEFVWENVATGAYSLGVLVTDNEGLTITTDSVQITVQEPQGPFLGYPHPIPGKIECEDYDFGGEGVSYHELSEGNKFLTSYHGDDPVDLEVSEDGGGGFQVGDFQDGEWLNYTVEVAERAVYDVEIRFATDMDETAISLSVDGMDRGTVSTPGTGGWQVFTSRVVKDISLTSGEHTLTMHCVKGYQNINWLRFYESTTGTEQIRVPAIIELSQNYPNPFSLSTSIQYLLPENCKVKLGVYNLLGMKVRSLIDEQQHAGSYEVDLNAEDLAPGVYVYRLEADQEVLQKRMMLK